MGYIKNAAIPQDSFRYHIFKSTIHQNQPNIIL